MKKKWWMVFVLIIAAGLGFWGYHTFLQSGSVQAAAAEQVTELVLVTRGALQDSIEGSGNLVPAREMSLAFGTSGQVAEVLVVVGDTVVEGQLLARLDTTTLEFSVAKAERSLEQAQIQLAQAQEPATAAEIARAEATLSAARASYAKAKQGSSPAQLLQLQGALDLAAKKVQQAQGNYDRHGDRMAGALQDATIAYDKAKLAYEIAQAGPASSSLISVWNQVEQAQEDLDTLRAGPDPDAVTSAELKVQQAQLALQQARRNLAEATLVAPFAGTVTAVNLKVGEMTSGAAITLADLATLEVEFNLDESDVTQVEVGQSAQVTVNAVSDLIVPGAVSVIAPTANVQSGVPLYPVTVQLRQVAPKVRAGMTVDLEVITEIWADVLYLPQRAVQLDGEQAFVMLQTGTGQFSRAPVTLGRSLGGNVEILNGLAEGDVVGVLTAIATSAENSSTQMRVPGMGFLSSGRP